jgi:plasmid stabilization system protein ParE
MTGRFVLTPRAQEDLDEIWDYMADRWGLDQAETCTRQHGIDVVRILHERMDHERHLP